MEQYINKIIHADCLDILKNIPNNYFDLCLTDPPYGINIEKMNFTNSLQGGVCLRNDYSNCFRDDKLSNEIFDEIFRISKNQIIFDGNYYSEFLKSTPSWIVWNKKGDGRYSNDFADGELAWTSFGKPLKIYHYLWTGMIQQDMKNKEKRIHPTQKPVGLLKQILRDYYKEGIVFDCFSGSGSTAIACYDLNIPFVAIEKDYDYWKTSVERLENAQAQLRLF